MSEAVATYGTTPREKLGCELAAEVLRSCGSLRLRVTGASMLPAVWPGDILEVRRANAAEVRPGQLMLYERDGGLVAHRVVDKVSRQGRTLLLTSGDRLQTTAPPVNPEALLGCVTQVLRGNCRMNPRLTFWGKIGSSTLSNSEFCTRLQLRLRMGRVGIHPV